MQIDAPSGGLDFRYRSHRLVHFEILWSIKVRRALENQCFAISSKTKIENEHPVSTSHWPNERGAVFK